MFSVALNVLGTTLVRGGQVQQELAKAGHTVAWGRREVGASIERHTVGRQEQGHGPATAAGHGLHRVHVDRVQVGAFFAVHLDVDEMAVHQRGRVGVLERFMRHDVAPVTGAITDAQENRFVFVSGAGQGFLAPGIPVHRVVRMLAQIGTGFAAQPVAEQWFAANVLDGPL